VRFPDVLTPVGSNTVAALQYAGGLPGAAAIQNSDSATGSRVVYFGFPFETVTSAALRESLMFDVLAFFDVIPAPVIAVSSIAPDSGTITILWPSITGRRYRLQFKNGLEDSTWTNAGGSILATGATASATDASMAGRQQRFYRVVMVD
jgi:hypothetical protein